MISLYDNANVHKIAGIIHWLDEKIGVSRNIVPNPLVGLIEKYFMRKLCAPLMFSDQSGVKTLAAIFNIIAQMHNFITKLRKILDIYKEFAGNRVN